jgi:ApaLI-like restriction endonuclease
MQDLIQKIRDLAILLELELQDKMRSRAEEMRTDENAHYLVYSVFGINPAEGQLIDQYQNKGRFLYKYAGFFLEKAATLCLNHRYPLGTKTKVENKLGQVPKTFEIDFLNGSDAIEIKWKDATTDGDHIAKEHARVKVIKEHGYKPIRIMFFSPQRVKAIKIQESLRTLYADIGGAYYSGDEAWDFLNAYSGVDLKSILSNGAKINPTNLFLRFSKKRTQLPFIQLLIFFR